MRNEKPLEKCSFPWSWTPGLIVSMAGPCRRDSSAKPDVSRFHVIVPCLRLLHDYTLRITLVSSCTWISFSCTRVLQKACYS